VGEHRDELSEEAVGRYHPTQRTPSNSEHQECLPKRIGGRRDKGSVDITIHVQVIRPCNYKTARKLIAPSSLDLLRSFYSEGLVDNRTFLSWLVLQMCTCNLAQAGFVARLADEYLDGILACRALSRPFVDACLSKLSEVQIQSYFFYHFLY
jgi:hypothetical protein